jgi:protein TonB
VNLVRILTVPVLAVVACSPRDDGTVRLGSPQDKPSESTADMPPVAINPVSPVVYPPVLQEQGIEGRVLLRLFVDSKGQVIADSTRLAESSGYPALDSAAVIGAAELRFSPALRNGRPIAAPFLQPVQFQHPRTGRLAP